jgi:hypothetical protein
LSGFEVVEDVLAQIRKRLHTDCSLRKEDGYSGGYSGTVTVKLNLHAVRISEVAMEIPITTQIAAPAAESFPPESVEAVEVDETIQIPLEPNLREIRERTLENNTEPQETEEISQGEEPETTTVQRRKYTRQAAMAGAVSE